MPKKNNLNIRLFKDFCTDEWDELLGTFDGTINYTAWFINYIEVLNAGSSIKNVTFGLFKDNVVIAIVPLYVEKVDSKWQMSMGQEPIYAPIFNKSVSNKEFNKYYDYLLSEVDRVAKNYNCKLARFQYSPLLNNDFNCNYFENFGYSDDIKYPDWYIFKAKYSYIVNLLVSKDELYRGVRKSNKPHVNRTRRETKLIVLDENNFDQSMFDQYVQLYYKIKGKKRNPSVFELDAVAVQKGFEVLLLCQYMDILIGAVALHTHNGKARYNSSVQDYDFDRSIYPNHFLLWESIVYLKEKGFDLFEIGEQVTESINLSSKERNLSHFKAGWGGTLVPWMKAQKEFDHA